MSKVKTVVTSVVNFILKFKNSVTNVMGFIYAFVEVIQPLLVGTEVTVDKWLTTIAIFLVSWFTGKNAK